MRKPDFCLCENKGAADQHLCFRYTDNFSSTYTQNLKILAFFYVCLCQTWSVILKASFLMSRLIQCLGWCVEQGTVSKDVFSNEMTRISQ